MSDVLISIIIPFYNAKGTLQDSVNSVLNQDYPNFEILLINDGSTDDSTSIVEKLKDERVLLFNQSNAGVAAARNLGIEKASGDFICFLDSDDLMTIDALSSRIAVFAEKPQLGIVAGAQEQKNFDLSESIIVQTPEHRGNPKLELVKLNSKCFINCGTWLIRKELIGEKRFPIGWTHSEDLAFFFMISENAQLDCVKNIVQIYRRHSNSAMSNLEGLELGYISFINLVRKHNVAIIPRIVLKLKSTKIMFLSFLAQGRKVRAISSIFRLLFA